MTAEATTRRPQFLAAMKRIQSLRRAGPWSELRKLFHDDALVESIAAGGVFGADETVEAMRVAAADGVYNMGEWRIEQLDPGIVLLSSRMRHLSKSPTGKPGMIDEPYVWLMVGRDELLWRMKVFRDRGTALDYLAEHGPGLGI